MQLRRDTPGSCRARVCCLCGFAKTARQDYLRNAASAGFSQAPVVMSAQPARKLTLCAMLCYAHYFMSVNAFVCHAALKTPEAEGA